MGNARRTAFISNSNSPPLPYSDPIYSEIGSAYSAAQMPPQRGNRLEPLDTNFTPILVPPSNHSNQRDQNPMIVGQKAARFNLIKLKKLLDRNPELRWNPIILTRRKCTDVFFGLLFILFMIGWGLVGYIAYSYGKPERVVYPTDSIGNACGKNRASLYDTSTKPYLLFFDLTKCISYNTILNDCPTQKICVSKCPVNYYSYVSLATMDLANFRQTVTNNVLPFCHYSVDSSMISNFTDLQLLVKAERCPSYTVPSASLFGRCVPGKLVDASNSISGNRSLNDFIRQFGDPNNLIPSEEALSASKGVVDKISKADSTAFLQKVAHDLSVSWWQILALVGFGAFVSFLWTVVMRFVGGLMIWLSIILLIAGLTYGSFYSFTKYQRLVQAGAINDYSFQPIVSVYFEMPNTWLAFAIILGVLLLVVLLIMLIIRSRIRLAIALISETSKALGTMLSTLFFPIFPFLLYSIVFVLWGSISIWLSSMGTENCQYISYGNIQDPNNGKPCDCSQIPTTNIANSEGAICRFINLTKPENQITALQAYNLFACFWMTCFVSGLSAMTISGAFASYYFAFRKPKDVPSFPVIQSMGRAIRYHLGTIALGSLILAIVKFFKVILDFVYNKLKGVENPVGKAIYRALSCLFWCLEKILQYLTKNAYIITAIYGSNFCTASRDSFLLLTRNLVRVVVLNRVTAFLLFVGKAVIVGGNGVLAFYYFTGRWEINGIPEVILHYEFVPIVVVIIGTYFIADLFFDVYDMGIDALFLCFLEDTEHNDGSTEKPYYMSDTLKRLNKDNKF